MSVLRPPSPAVTPPRLTFFCELDAGPLSKLFSDPAVIDSLRRLGAAISLGLIDLSAERAITVRRLNAASIPVTAWLLLPREHGYFQHVDNAAESTSRFEDLREWTRREGLVWTGIGLDIEQDRRALEVFGAQAWRAVPSTVRRAFDGARLQRGLDGYRSLIARMRADAWRVESYQFPAIADDRQAGSRLLQRAFGVMDLEVDCEVWMLYSSILPPRGPGWLCSYGPQAQAIAVGSTGGGIDSLPKLSWDELRRDLLLARRWTEHVYVFSLEGCVARGLLPRIASIDWTQADAIPIPSVERRRIDQLRRALHIALRASARMERMVAALARSML